MQREQGLHLYINILNFDKILEEEEKRLGEPTHSIHALDSYFSSIEKFVNKYVTNSTVEKITGSRLHVYIISDLTSAYKKAKKISVFAHKLASYLLDNVRKYNSLVRFRIQIGLAYGNFYIFKFENNSVSEITSIGYAANYAAKLQSLSDPNYLSLSKNIYDNLLSTDKQPFVKKESSTILKYSQSCYYTCPLSNINDKEDLQNDLMDAVQYANKVNLNQMTFRSATKPVNFNNLSKTECKKIDGIPLFADVRGFTSKFNADDSNLEEMKVKTTNILNSMYNCIISNKGIHIQFQGDREFALFHNYSNYTCYKDALIAGLRIIDVVHNCQVSVGVGLSSGIMFASKIGAHGEKDFVLLGSTVNDANVCEDKYAKENQLVITSSVYNSIRTSDSEMAKQFSKIKGTDLYFTTKGYNHYSEAKRLSQLRANNSQNNYNGAWLDE